GQGRELLALRLGDRLGLLLGKLTQAAHQIFGIAPELKAAESFLVHAASVACSDALLFTQPVGRMGQGWQLAKKSLFVVRKDGSLVALTILGGISAAAIGLALFIPAALAGHNGSSGVAVLLGALGAYLATATGVFFAVALASCAAEVLDGKDATVGG